MRYKSLKTPKVEQITPMKNKLLYYVLSFFIFSVCSCSCDKTIDDPNNGLWTIDQGVKDYSLFKPGTYWVYEDSATGVLDSVYVYDFRSGIDTSYSTHGELFGYFEYFFVYALRSIDGYTEEYSVNASWGKGQPTMPIWKSRYKPSDYVGTTFLMEYPFIVGKNYYPFTQDGIVTCTGFYENIILNNVPYNSVAKFYDSKNITENNSPSYGFIAKNIGIVRKEIIESHQVWNLSRYHIVQ